MVSGEKATPIFAQHLPAEDLALDRQATPLVIVEPDAPLAVGFLQNLVLGADVLDDLLLLPVDQAGQDAARADPPRVSGDIRDLS
jgi:hypothetical protein